MAKRVGFYKYRGQKRHYAADLAVMTLAVGASFFAGVMLFELAWPQRLPADGAGAAGAVAELALAQLRGAADMQPEPQRDDERQVARDAALARNEARITVEKHDGYAYLGQKDVDFLRFRLNPTRDAKLMKLTVRLDGYARPSDVKSLQLYFENRLVAQVPFFEAKGVFDGLNIRLPAHESAEFEVKGNISEEAFSGDRLQTGFQSAQDILVRDEEMNDLPIEADFPLWGGYVSVIGNRKSG